jgi:glycosyltransferase involved in cell wall biosynthesis
MFECKVSIIIPSHNKGLYISACITSALNQSFKNIEVIVVDDNSIDNTKSILENLCDTRLHVYYKKYNNASAARNFGMTKATGKFIQFLDADDFLHPSKIEKQLIDMNYDEDVLGVCNTKAFYSDVNDDGLEVDTDFLQHSSNPFEFLTNLYNSVNSGMVQPNAWLTSKKMINEVGFWNETLTVDDDGEFFCRIILNCSKIIHTNEILNFYRKYKTTKSNLSAQISALSYRSMLDSAILKRHHIYCYIKKYNLEYDINPLSNVLFINVMILTYPNYYDLYTQARELYNDNYEVSAPILGGKLVEIFKSIFGWRFTKRVMLVLKR